MNFKLKQPSEVGLKGNSFKIKNSEEFRNSALRKISKDISKKKFNNK